MGVGSNWMYGTCCSAQMPHKRVQTILAEQTTGAKKLLSKYTYCGPGSELIIEMFSSVIVKK